ncbi:MAG: response regulator transcription factor [Bacteroidia bacterium]|nr:response regulator transcription factor [Bacteroidia bacterium]
MEKTLIIVDDHQMFAEALADIIARDTDFKVLCTVRNGRELLQKLQPGAPVPGLVLLDLNMPEMDGHATALHLREHFPAIKFMVLSMNGEEDDILKMLKAGCCGYILKEAPRSELKMALQMVFERGYYHSDLVANLLVQSLYGGSAGQEANPLSLSEREKEFLPLACTELTYKEIADKMCVAERTVDGYRESLFQKLGVKSRVGLAIFAVRNGLVEI